MLTASCPITKCLNPLFHFSNIPSFHLYRLTVRTLTIQQVSRRLNLTTHTLRFWEKELEGILTPLRTQGGQRRYTPDHLFLLEEIKRLKRSGLSLIDIKDKLNSSSHADQGNSNTNKIDLLADQVAEIVRTAIHRFFETETTDL
jgi:DNA-binding transcriptional MerR regulator